MQQVVWPDKRLRETKAANATSSSHFTLQAGSYTFPFRLRLPVNNSCQPPPGAMSRQNFHFTNNAIATVTHPENHVKQTLPPSLGGINDAYIRYFVKVTVNRPSFFSRNHRHIVPFVFCPIEPPRPPPQNNQVFVRKKHTLALSAKQQDPGFLAGLFKKTPLSGNGGTIIFEARLPNPPIVVPTEPIPLTLLVKRDSGSEGVVYIRSVRILLGMTTFIAAQGFRRELGYVLPILTSGNLNLTLPANKNEIVINPADLIQQSSQKSKGVSLPDTVPPSFRTCNIARKYTLLLELGLSAHHLAPPETIRLNFDIQVFSGFKPPPELLAASHPSEPPPPQPQPQSQAPDSKTAETAQLETANLPTYDEAVADTLGSPATETGRGHFEVDAQHLQGAESWDDEKK